MNSCPRLLNIKEAALHIGVHYRQLLDSVSDGTIPTYRLHKSRKLVDVDEVVAIMREQGGSHE
ncbi:MAG: hypothetical protein VXY16_03270 [Pseudomonadota bacterium]|nr:hypothetical protein [Pseudomonadota bacterium]